MNLILYPMFAMVLLTFVVWACLGFYRVNTLIKNNIHPQVVADELKASEVYKSGTNLSDNFENLFEMPILFYAAVLTTAHLGIKDTLSLSFAWAFVIFRAAHTLVHVSSNVIRLRFAFYLFSSLCLLGMWVVILLSIQ